MTDVVCFQIFPFRSVFSQCGEGTRFSLTRSTHMPDKPKPGDETAPGTPQSATNICGKCGGTGKTGEKTCPACEGTGRVTTIVGDA
jgi:hypothetical protein